MSGFNDLKEQFEAQGIAVSSKNLNSNKNVNLSENSASKMQNSQNAEFESFADKEKRLRAEFAEFLKGESILKNIKKA